MLQFSLEAEGYTTFAASNGIEAMAEISLHRPDPHGPRHHDAHMDGWAVLEAMTELPPNNAPGS